MRKRIFHNWGLKLISLFLASILWFLVAKVGDPSDTVTFNNVKVVLKNAELLEKENKVYEVLDKTDNVRVTIRAPRSITSELRASDVIAEADMGKLTDINTIAISYLINNGAQVQSIAGDHDFVRLTVEERVSKWIRVQYHIEGEVAENYMVGSASPDQNLIEVSGPKSAVENISYAKVEVDVTGATNNMSLNVEPQLYSSGGKELDLPSVTKNVSYIHMAVEVLAVKEVPIELNVMGVPADGYIATGVTGCSLSTVKIAGTPTALATVSKISIPKEELNITGESSNMVNMINVKDFLPDNIRLADSSFNGRITATVYIEEKANRTFTLKEDKIAVLNVPEGFEARLVNLLDNTDEIGVLEFSTELTVAGLSRDVSKIEEGSISGTIDVKAWMDENKIRELSSGIYEIPVTFSLPKGIEMKQDVMVHVALLESEEI